MSDPNQLISAFPELTDELIAEANKCFTPYIFYKDANKIRNCECTSCNTQWEYPARVMGEDDFTIKNGKHNEKAVCTFCGVSAKLKNRSRFKSCASFNEFQRIIFIIPKSCNEIYMRAFVVHKDYGANTVSLNYETKRYYIAPNEVYSWSCGYFTSWALMKTYCAVAFHKDGYTEHYKNWHHVGASKLKDTFLKYSQYDNQSFVRDLGKDHLYRLLCNYALYPQIEFLVKFGFIDFAGNAVVNNKFYRKILNWKATDALKFFKLNKSEFNEFVKYGGTPDLLLYYKAIKKIDNTAKFEYVKNVIDGIGLFDIEKFIEIIKNDKISYKRLNDYITLHKGKYKRDRFTEHTFTLYYDYINMAKKLEYDLQNEVVVFPKNLKKAHDTAVKLYSAVKHEVEVKSMKSLTDKLNKKYSYENDTFIIRAPTSMQEIINEGKALRHCVGSYAERHANSKTVILFLRHKDDPDTPFFTVEMHGKEYRQIQGFKNSAELTADVKEFFDNFLEHIKTAGHKLPAAS